MTAHPQAAPAMKPAAKRRVKLAGHIPVLSAEAAGALLLNAQGLLHDPARRIPPNALCKLIEQMGFVQIDTINVVERAHHLTLHSRADHYTPRALTKLLEHDRRLFEHWTHDASAIPSAFYAHWRHRFDRARRHIQRSAWWRERLGPSGAHIVEQVRRHIADNGPVLSRDFEHAPADSRNGEVGWWGWKPHKAALEYLWRTGELAVVKRVNFQKVYDLSERVLPEHHARPASSIDEHVEWACRSAWERLVVATPSEIAKFWHAIDLTQARRWCGAAAADGDVVPVMVQSICDQPPRAALALPDWEARLGDAREAMQHEPRIRLLSPFDPVIRDRQRALRLFGFDYRFEAFVPAPQRRYGYFVMPMLEGQRMIGRLDPKFHRDRGVLEIKGLWLEPTVRWTKRRAALVEEAVGRLAEFIGARDFVLPPPR